MTWGSWEDELFAALKCAAPPACHVMVANVNPAMSMQLPACHSAA